MAFDASGTTNITQTLSNLFEEVLHATEDSGENKSVDVTKFLSVLRETSTKRSDAIDFGTLVKLVDGWRMKLNLTKPAESCDYCDGSIRDIILAYNSIHGYVSLIVCLFGSLANTLNVAVLTRRDLAAAPINRLLKWLAVADVFVMMEYVPFAIYRYMILPGQREMPYKWAAYLLFHMHFAQIFHTASICLTLSLAIWRYVAIKYSDRSHVLCTERRCSTAILTSFILPPILCIPTIMVFDVHTAVVLEANAPVILYHVDADDEGQLYQINFWVHAVVIKLLPCFILTVISMWLIREVYSANEHQKKIRVYNACPTNNKNIKRQWKGDKRTNRTTKMLVAVLLLFLVTELPQGVLGLLSGILGRCFFKRCYDLFGELMDALALLNGAINFVLYCSMSRQFRMTFRQLMWRTHLHRWPPPQASNSDGLNTYSDRSHVLCTERRCSTAILTSFILPPILCIPTIMVFDVHTAVVLEANAPVILYHVDADDEGQLYQINFWVHAVVIKLLPCFILTVISLWLIREVYSANEHQKKIRVYNACPTNNKNIKRQWKGDKRTNRTTKMLVAVLLLFLVTELPQGVLGLLSGILGRCFFKRCYNLFGELMDALALLNGAINFVLYCTMSRQFRMTFRQLMWRTHLHRWPPPQASNSDGLNTAKTSIP